MMCVQLFTSETTVGEPVRGTQHPDGHRQAEGMVMERFDLSPQPAYDVLRRVSSSRSDEKLRQVALALVHTGRLPRFGPPTNQRSADRDVTPRS
jgi:hypothetical protein